MVPGADVMHGEAVNIDGFFCVVLSHLRGLIGIDLVHRVFDCMKALSLPTNSPDLQLDLLSRAFQNQGPKERTAGRGRAEKWAGV